jgi:hypothetical protein
MPAQPHLVSLAQAKAWAKRLLKGTPALTSLAQAQTAVATMLGHASWHALTQYYQAATPEPTVPSAAVPPPVKPSFDEGVAALKATLQAAYPGLAITHVVEMARDLDLLDISPTDLADEIQATYRQTGESIEQVVKESLRPHTVEIHVPPSHIFVRVQTASGQDVLTLVSAAAYGQAFGHA